VFDKGQIEVKQHLRWFAYANPYGSSGNLYNLSRQAIELIISLKRNPKCFARERKVHSVLAISHLSIT
jgi:hypothetical protein